MRDGKNSDPVSGINIPNPQHCLSLLQFSRLYIFVMDPDSDPDPSFFSI